MNQKISKTNLKDVIIIGAGAAGLYAGYLLKAQGFDVQILEANNRVGGRIKSLEDFTDFPVELGAMYLHGDKNLFSQLIDYMGLL
jgi:monoamine oxidase